MKRREKSGKSRGKKANSAYVWVCVCAEAVVYTHTSHQLSSFQCGGVRRRASEAARGCYGSVRVTEGLLKAPGIGHRALSLLTLIDAGCQAKGVEPLPKVLWLGPGKGVDLWVKL